MKGLPLEITQEFLKEVIHIQHLFTLTLFSATYRWTDGRNSVYYGGHWFVSKDIQFESAGITLTSQVDSMTLLIGNILKSFSNLAMTQELRGKQFLAERVLLDRNLAVIGLPKTLFLGFFDEQKIDRRMARVQIFNHMIKWKTLTPKRLHPPTCPWVFKGTECTYNGILIVNPISDYSVDFTRSHGSLNYANVDDYLTDLTIGGTFSADSFSGAGNEADKAFDDNNSTYWNSGDTLSHWLKCQFAAAKKITRYSIYPQNQNVAPKEFKLQACNDDLTWVDLDYRYGVTWPSTPKKRVFEIRNTVAYAYYRLYIISNMSGETTQIKEFELIGPSDQKNDADYNYTNSTSAKADLFSVQPIIGPRNMYNSLLHCDGLNDSTIIVDEYGHTWVCYLNAKLSTAGPKFGTAALLSAHDNSCIYTSAFASLGGKFTVEEWWNPSDVTATDQLLFYHSNAGGYGLMLRYNVAGDKKIHLNLSSNGTTWDIANDVVGSKADWANGTKYKIIVDYDGSTYRVFQGISGALTVDISVVSALPVCSNLNAFRCAYNLAGSVDEIRTTIWANRYGASANAETAPFTADSFGGSQAQGVCLASDVTGISVMVSVRAKQSVASARNLSGRIRIGGVNYDATAINPATSFTDYDFVWVINPATGIAWNFDLSSIQDFGYSTPANAGGNRVDVSQCFLKITNGVAGLTCDGMPERCKALNNRDNFGGFIYMPEMAIKEFWWGSKQRIWSPVSEIPSRPGG